MIGSKLQDRYELTEQLGRGGMGVVYRAWDPVLHREVAIKMIPPLQLNRETEERFQREAQLVAGMDHPAIVAIHDFGRHDGSLFFVMPFVQGTLLQEHLHERALILDEILDIGIQVAEALEYSHSRGVVHRDVKPGNIMITREHRGPRARVLDFGLARGAAERRLTKTGGLVGTLTNLSPEQIATGTVDPRSDIYALGTVLHEALTGEPPFSGAVHSVLYRIVHESAPTLADRDVDFGEELEQLLGRCLAKDPAQRPQRGAELAAELAIARDRLDDGQRLRTVGGQTRPVALKPTQPIPSPLVGRQTEWAELQSCLAAALAGECQFVLVDGDAGTGKSRLLLELENLARARRLQVLRGRFVDRESAIPYQGLCELVQDYFRQREPASSSTGDRSSGTRPVSADFSDLAADLVSFFPVLSEIRELRGPTGAEATPDPSFPGSASSAGLAAAVPDDPTRLYELLARALARIGGGRPLVLLVENLHEGAVSLAALTYIVRRLGPTPTLIAGTCRRSEIDPGHPFFKMQKSFADDPRFWSIRLGALGAADFRRLVELQLGNEAVREDLLNRLYEATEGNPYFGQELVRWLLETGGLSRDESGTWTLLSETGFATEALPATIQQAVERRIERLERPLRHLLSLASVLGKSFTSQDLEVLVKLDSGRGGGHHAADREGADLDDAIDKLVEVGLLEEDPKSRDDRLHFSRGLIRDILYHELSRRKRRSLHRRYAYELEKRHPDRLERFYPQLVHHFSEGDEAERTIRYALGLARKSLAAYSGEDAVHALRAALDFVDEDSPPELEGELLELLSAAYRATGSTAKAVSEAERAADAYERAGDCGKAAAAALLAAETAWHARRVDTARPWVDRGIELAQSCRATETLRRLLTLGATVANLRGEHHQARRYLEEAEQLAPAAAGGGRQEPVPAGGVLRAVLPYPVHSVDPMEIRTDEEFEAAANIFETLLSSDADGNLVPALCEEWRSLDNGRTFELTLRGDVSFSDGWPLRARDVKAAFERSKKAENAYRGPGFSAVRELEVVEGAAPAAEDGAGPAARPEPDRLRFHLKEPLPIFPALLTDASTAIVRQVEQDDGTCALVGTGPFRLAGIGGDRVLLERNPSYWRGTPPPLDRIELSTSLDPSGIAAGLRAGDLDLGRDLAPAELESIQRDPRFRSGVVEATKKNVYFVLFNQAGPVACHREVRRALVSVVRVQDLVWRTLGRFAQPAVCLVPPGILGHDPGRRYATVPRREAGEELRKVGIDRPIRLRAAIHPLFHGRYETLITALFDEWSALGVEVVDLTPSMDEYLEYWSGASDVDLLIGRWNADFDDPDTFTHGLFHSVGGRLRQLYSSPEVDRLLERARQENHTARRLAHYQRFEELLNEDHVLLPLFHDVDYRIAGPHVLRLRLGSSPPYVNYSQLAKRQETPAAVPARRRLVDGGELHVGLPVRFSTLDPTVDNVSEHFEPKVNLFETLTQMAEGARVVPWLAAFFEVPGGAGYHFRLREKVRFHDGRRLTARDVRYSFERLLKTPDCKFHFMLLPVRGARALRDGRAEDLEGFRILTAEQFVIELERPLSFFPALVSHPGLGIVPEGMTEFDGSWRDGSVGTGPFRLVRFDAQEGVDLERNPHYWRPEYPRAHRLQFHFGLSTRETLDEFRAGRLSIVGSLRPGDVGALRRDPEFAAGYEESPRLSTAFLSFNSRQGLFVDIELRRAFAAALDVETLLRESVETGAMRARGLLAPGLLGYEPRHVAVRETRPKAYDFRGMDLRIALHPAFLSQYAGFLSRLRQALTDLGFRVQVADRPLTEIVRDDDCGSIDVAVGRWIADYPDADAFVVGLLHSREGVMKELCSSPEIDDRIEKGRHETDPTLRHAIYREIEEIIARDRLLIPLFHEQNYRFSHPTVRGLKLGLALPEVRYEELYIVR